MNRFLSILTFILTVSSSVAFSIAPHYKPCKNVGSISSRYVTRVPTRISAGEDIDSGVETKKMTLEEKMAGWEASEEEIKAASLGGITPGKGTDGFDIGLYIAFPIIVATSLLFAVFPFIMDKIDVSSVGPPPTV